MSSISLPMSVLLPTPALPVMAMTLACRSLVLSAARTAAGSWPRLISVSTRDKANRSPARNRCHKSSGMCAAPSLAQKIDDLDKRGPRPEDPADSHLCKLRGIFFRHDSPHHHADVYPPRLPQQLEHARDWRHVRSAEHAPS